MSRENGAMSFSNLTFFFFFVFAFKRTNSDRLSVSHERYAQNPGYQRFRGQQRSGMENPVWLTGLLSNIPEMKRCRAICFLNTVLRLPMQRR